MFLNFEDIESWEYVDDVQTVYDVEVEDHHNYFIYVDEDVLVHNSGKTYSILQVLFTIAIEDAGSVITVVGQDIPNLKKGALRDANHIVASSPILQTFIKSYNKSDRIYEFKNGSIIEFTSYSDEQDAKSGKRDYLFVNEANGIEWLVYWQLAIRTKKKIFIDYNPTAKFWVHEKLIGKKDCTLFISDHRHNPFLSDEQHAEIEAIEDPELRKVYARGLTGKITGLIWPHYKMVEEIPDFLESCYGLDIGYNHPTALTEVAEWFEEKAIYADEIIYESSLTTGDLIEQFKLNGVSKSKPMYVDKARPDVIDELVKAGYNALPADKDVLNGINYVRYRKLFITKRSKNAKKELDAYKWKEDSKTGKQLDEPVKFKDDACFVGNTMISTISGQKRIDELKSGDFVFTSQGLRRINEAYYNGFKEIFVFSIFFNNFVIKVECTKDHKILINNQWKPISQLQKGDKVNLFKYSMENHSHCILEENTSLTEQNHYTEKFINSFLVKFQKDFIFTTKMKMSTITNLPILNLKKGLSTLVNTQKKEWKEIPSGMISSKKQELNQQKNGIQVKKVLNGTKNILMIVWEKLLLKGNANVNNAESNLKQMHHINKKDFVQINASQNGEEIVDLTTSKKNVKNAKKYSHQINTIKKDFAQTLVVEKVIGELKGVEKVYDLNVDDVHEYFANGLLVHNCDSLRYGAYSNRNNQTKISSWSNRNSSFLDSL